MANWFGRNDANSKGKNLKVYGRISCHAEPRRGHGVARFSIFMKSYYVYILTNFANNVFYIGVSNSIERRLSEHLDYSKAQSFTKKYKTTKLVYYEEYKDILEAIAREKQLKNWHREWKINLITEKNPSFRDLYY